MTDEVSPTIADTAGSRRFTPIRVLSFVVVAALIALASGALTCRLRAAGPPSFTPPALLAASGPSQGETMLWRPVAIGGGGFITGMSWDDRGINRVVRTDVYGAYRWDGAIDRWRQLVIAAAMPEADRVQDGIAEGVYEIAVAPRDPQRVYMVTRDRVYRSDDGGRNWTWPASSGGRTFDVDPNSPYRLRGPFMAVSPSDPDVVLLGTQSDGLWRSRDGAATWDRIEAVPTSKPDGEATLPPGIVVGFGKGAQGERFWAAPAGQGLYGGHIDGADVSRIATGGGPATIARAAVAAYGDMFAADPENSTIWQLAGGRWIDPRRSSDLAQARFQTIAVDPVSGAVIAADNGGRLQCSANGGKSWIRPWRSIGAGQGDPPWLRVTDRSFFATAEIAFDPREAGRLWTASGAGVYTASLSGPCAAVAWESRTRGVEELVANDVIHAPGFAPVFAGWDFGIHVKPDLDAFSNGYGPRERVLISAQQLDWTPAKPGFVVTNASDANMKCCWEDGLSVLAGYSEDGGRTWARFGSLPAPPGTDPKDPWRMAFGSIAVASNDPDNIVWLPALDRSPYFTRDRGRHWERVKLPGERLPLTGSYGPHHLGRKNLTADRVLPRTFYLLHSGNASNPQLAGFWRTRDGGAKWVRVFSGEVLPASRYSAKLRAVPGRAGYLFLTNGVKDVPDTRLRRTLDGGRTWQTLGRVTRVDDIGFGKAAKGAGRLAIYISGRVDGVYGIWRSLDDARTWQRLIDFPLGSLDQVTSLDGDKDVFGRVYIGYKGSGWIVGEPARCTAQAAPAGWQCRAIDPAAVAGPSRRAR